MENGSEGLVFVSVWRRINTAGTSGEAFCHLSPVQLDRIIPKGNYHMQNYFWQDSVQDNRLALVLFKDKYLMFVSTEMMPFLYVTKNTALNYISFLQTKHKSLMHVALKLLKTISTATAIVL